MRPSILLIGGQETTKALAQSLAIQDYEVTVIHPDYEVCIALAEITGIRILHGDGAKPYILEEAKTSSFDIAIALTEYDDDNLVICELCKKRFGVRKTVCVIKNSGNTEFFRKMGVDSVVCATNTIASIIEQETFLDSVATALPLGNDQLQILKVVISKNAVCVGKTLQDLALPNDVIVVCILRQEQPLVPRGNTMILAQDSLLIVSAIQQERKCIQILTGRTSL